MTGETNSGVFMLFGQGGTGKTAILNYKIDEHVRSNPSAKVIEIDGSDVKAYRTLMTELARKLTG